MNRTTSALLSLLLVLATAGGAWAQSVQIRLEDGSRWRGEVSEQVEVTYLQQRVDVTIQGELITVADLYIVVEGDVAGQVRKTTIFRDDIKKMRTLGGTDEGGAAASGRSSKSRQSARETASDGDDDADFGVFYLPMDGGVGDTFRHDEIDMIGEEADKYGPGQIIILHINSNGGLVYESELITESIWELKKRHRVVAWVKKAISAGCSTAMVCDEIYFMSVGTAGSVTTISGSQHVPEAEAQPGIDYLVKIAREAGYSEHIARSMKLKKYMCSYDKDKETGEVTWYDDLSGEHKLSSDEQNLCFNARTAVHCGFAKGIADSEEELAHLLDLPEWREKSTYGREIAKEWQDTVERCKHDVTMLLQRRAYKGTAGDAQERLGTLISINNKIIRWVNRCPLVCYMEFGLQSAEPLERENEQLRKQLADLRRSQRGGGR